MKTKSDKHGRKMILIDYKSDDDIDAYEGAFDYSDRNVTISQLNNHMREILLSKTKTEEEKFLLHSSLLRKYFQLKDEEEKEKLYLLRNNNNTQTDSNSVFRNNMNLDLPYPAVPKFPDLKQRCLTFTNTPSSSKSAQGEANVSRHDETSLSLDENELFKTARKSDNKKKSSKEKKKKRSIRFDPNKTEQRMKTRSSMNWVDLGV